jgi:hypothetical protein
VQRVAAAELTKDHTATRRLTGTYALRPEVFLLFYVQKNLAPGQ